MDPRHQASHEGLNGNGGANQKILIIKENWSISHSKFDVEEFVLRRHDPKLFSCLHLNVKFQKEIGHNHLNSLPHVLFICCYIGSFVVSTCL